MRFETDKEFFKTIKIDYDRLKNKEEIEPEIYSGKTYDKETLKDSFAYKYFKEWKERTAEKYINDREWLDEYIKSGEFAKGSSKKVSPDKYEKLYAAYRLFTENRIDIELCKKVFIDIAGKKEGNKKGNKKTIQKIEDGDIAEAYEKLSYDLLRRVIDDKLRNESGKLREKSGKAKKESSEDSLDVVNMLYNYLYKHCKNKGANDNALTADYQKKYRELFDLILANGSDEIDNVFIPLYVDKSSGAGVYIIGNYHLRLTKADKAKLSELKKCGVYTVSFIGSNMDADVDYILTDDGSLENITMPIDYELKRFENVEDAFDYFRYILDDNENDDYYYGYRGANSNVFYDPVKEKFGKTFLRCFDMPQETPQERKRTEKELAIIKNQKEIEEENKKKYNLEQR